MYPHPLRQNPRITCREIDGETMLYDPSSESIHVLNPAAAVIWQLCDGEHNVEAIVAALGRTFAGTEAADLRADVAETLRTFHALGLLESGKAESTQKGKGDQNDRSSET